MANRNQVSIVMQTVPGQTDTLDKKSLDTQKMLSEISRVSYLPSNRKYNLTVSHSSQFIWFRVAKVGTRTIYNHLKNSDIKLELDHAHGVYYPVKFYQNYFKFAFVRNPWDRLVSCWWNKVIAGNEFNFDELTLSKLKIFEYFVDHIADMDIENCNIHYRLQSSLIDLNNVDYIGRMETFEKDLLFIFDKIGINDKHIETRNKSANRSPYQTYYNDKLAAKVEDLYRKDIQIFNYRFTGAPLSSRP